MRIAIVTVGSLGDVRPYVALGAGLRAAGHRVLLATHAPYAALARDNGLDFFPFAGDSQEVLGSDDGRRWLHSGRNPYRFMTGLRRVVEPLVREVMAQCRTACHDADVIVASVLGFCAAYHVAEKLRVPLVPAFYLPLTPTRAFPAVMCPVRGLGGAFNRWTHRVTGQFLWESLRPAFNRARQDELDLPPLPAHRVARQFFSGHWHILYGYSPTLVPRPGDWGDRVHVTGYWFLDRPGQWQPPARLVDFLTAGQPPIYIGFGSMQMDDASAVTAMAVAALARTRQRGVLLTTRGGLAGDHLPDHVIGVESAPHDWLFPRMAAVVHHGGAGTTAAAVRAGVPSAVVPFFADQPFWASRLSELRIAPRPVPRRSLTAARLADAIRAATSDPGMKRRALLAGERVRAEDGVARAVEAFERNGRDFRV